MKKYPSDIAKDPPTFLAVLFRGPRLWLLAVRARSSMQPVERTEVTRVKTKFHVRQKKTGTPSPLTEEEEEEEEEESRRRNRAKSVRATMAAADPRAAASLAKRKSPTPRRRDR